MSEPTKKPRGFATLTPERRREIAAMGGRASPGSKLWIKDADHAKTAGRKGGKNRWKSRLPKSEQALQ